MATYSLIFIYIKHTCNFVNIDELVCSFFCNFITFVACLLYKTVVKLQPLTIVLFSQMSHILYSCMPDRNFRVTDQCKEMSSYSGIKTTLV